MIARRLIGLATLLMVAAGFAPALAADNDGPTRFHDVTRWWGKLQATARAAPESVAAMDLTLLARKGSWRTVELGASVTIEFLLDNYESDPSVWRGRVKSATGHLHYNLFSHIPDLAIAGTGNHNARTGFRQHEWWVSADGHLDFRETPEVRLEFHRQRGWSVRMGSGRLPAETFHQHFKRAPRLSEQTPDHDFIIDTDRMTNESLKTFAVGMGSTETLPYPDKGLQLSATGLKKAANFPVLGGLTMPRPGIVWDYSIHLEPASSDELRLEIEETAAYRDWRPSATVNGGPGTPLEITAKLVTADGKTPRIRVKQFEWRLEDTSREPGIAMNFPIEAPDDDRPDLELDATGDLFELSGRNQRMVRAVREGFSDTVKVVPYDWGGWSTLRVTAVLVDDRRVEGTLKGSIETGVRLPKRAAGSKIADSWKRKTGASGADSTDDENTPVGDATKGDGFTLYQEYRGFYESGSHLEGDPKRKDFFVLLVNAGIALPGVQKFARVTGLRVHHQLAVAEFPLSRIMNGNRKSGAHIANQHGVFVWVNGDLHGYSQAIGGPGSPKKIDAVVLTAEAAAADAAWLKSTVAHELGHSVNLWHHGEADDMVEWRIRYEGIYERKTGATRAEDDLVVVMDEAGDNQTEVWKNIIRNSEGGVLTQWRGRDQGQHSGFDNCLMRYDCAEIYVYRSIPIWRVALFNEPVGHALCVKPDGSGVNDPNRDPIGRYGPAAQRRGDCLHQIHVNDAVEAPGR